LLDLLGFEGGGGGLVVTVPLAPRLFLPKTRPEFVIARLVILRLLMPMGEGVFKL
jgi:hypothetical protein